MIIAILSILLAITVIAAFYLWGVLQKECEKLELDAKYWKNHCTLLTENSDYWRQMYYRANNRLSQTRNQLKAFTDAKGKQREGLNELFEEWKGKSVSDDRDLKTGNLNIYGSTKG